MLTSNLSLKSRRLKESQTMQTFCFSLELQAISVCFTYLLDENQKLRIINASSFQNLSLASQDQFSILFPFPCRVWPFQLFLSNSSLCLSLLVCLVLLRIQQFAQLPIPVKLYQGQTLYSHVLPFESESCKTIFHSNGIFSYRDHFFNYTHPYCNYLFFL